MQKEKKPKQEKANKPLYKRWWFWLIILMIIIIAIGSGGSDGIESQNSTSGNIEDSSINLEESTEENQSVLLPDDENTSPETIIEQVIRDRISAEYTHTDIDRITINEDLGTDVEGDYVVLVYLTWTQKNNGKLSKEVLKLYSDDLAAATAKECASVQELAIFWTVPYLNNANAKCSYERKNGGMYEMDMMWDNVFDG